MDFRLGRNELSQDAAQTERVFAERRSDPTRPRGRGIALIEDEVNNLEDRGEARHALGPARDLEPDVRLGEGPLRADDALGHARDRDEERSCDLFRRQAADYTQG